jgi:hypothetical protein
MRKIVALLAAAGLLLGTATFAHADPPLIINHCSEVKTVAPSLSEKTCSHTQSRETSYVQAYVYLTNNSLAPVTVRADLLVGGGVVPGVDTTVAPGHADFVWSNAMENPPCGEWCVGRGYLSSGGWSLYTYSNQ